MHINNKDIFMVKWVLIFVIILLSLMTITACKTNEIHEIADKDLDQNEEKNLDDMEMENSMNPFEIMLSIDTSITYQTIESFGTSGAWWSQYVGGWDNLYADTGLETREVIARLLFDKEEGIGLTAYRYNLGAGSADSGLGAYWDIHRRAQSLESAPGIYNWDKDESAIWFMKEATRIGATEVILFANSPLERLTINGMAQVSKGENSNILPEQYPEWAKYVMDVAEHFVSEGIPVRFISPINEPQWDWFEGQEGCHFEPSATTDVYLAFLNELEKRPTLDKVSLSGPESGEWGGRVNAYTMALLDNKILSEHLEEIDNHSYWTDAATKEAFKRFMDSNYPQVKLRTSEWCEMVSGSDLTMDSAFNLSRVIVEDLTILDVVSWQNWVALAPGGYRDGLIYINEEKQSINPLRRLWAFGNYSRYIRPGYTRVSLTELTRDSINLDPVAFKGMNDEGQEELVIVVINQSDEIPFINMLLSGIDGYDSVKVFETSETRDLEEVYVGTGQDLSQIPIGVQSISTIVLTKINK